MIAANANPIVKVAASVAAMCGTAPSSSTPPPIPTSPHSTRPVSENLFATCRMICVPSSRPTPTMPLT